MGLLGVVCIHQGEDGTVCGQPEAVSCDHCGFAIHAERAMFRCSDGHPMAPGRKCPTCDGSGRKVLISPGALGLGGAWIPCPTCADSPVRGYVPV